MMDWNNVLNCEKMDWITGLLEDTLALGIGKKKRIWLWNNVMVDWKNGIDNVIVNNGLN